MRRLSTVCLVILLGGCPSPTPEDRDAPLPDVPGTDAPGADVPSDLDGGGLDAPIAAGPHLVDLSAGSNATCAVLDDGTVRCWGDNRERQLGSGTTVDESVLPLAVASIDDAVEVSVGYEFACARHAGGTVSCWGAGTNGRLGNGTTDDQPTPVPVAGLTGVVEIEVGLYIACARRDDDTEWCWGRMADIGNGFEGSMVPVAVTGLSGVSSIALAPNAGTGSNSTVSCGVRDGGAAYCWGYNNYGQLGIGDQSDSRVPVAVGVLTGVTAISPGGIHTCALATGGAFCWGFPGYVGDGNGSDNRFSPTAIAGAFVAIDAGDTHTCAVDAAGAVSCWGNCGRGQCGDGSTLSAGLSLLEPTATVGLAGVELLSAGANHTCAYTSAGVTYCWGDTTYGQLGSGEATSLERVNAPRPVVW